METLRELLVRHANELADALEAAPRQDAAKAAPRKRRARGPVIVAPSPREMTPERREYAQRYVRRALGQ